MAQIAQNNKFVESRFETELLMSGMNNNHNRLVITGTHK